MQKEYAKAVRRIGAKRDSFTAWPRVLSVA